MANLKPKTERIPRKMTGKQDTHIGKEQDPNSKFQLERILDRCNNATMANINPEIIKYVLAFIRFMVLWQN